MHLDCLAALVAGVQRALLAKKVIEFGCTYGLARMLSSSQTAGPLLEGFLFG